MTRKRFCWLVMGAGISRNRAKFLATCLSPQHSYQELFATPDISLEVAWARLGLELKTNLRPTLRKMKEALADAIDHVEQLRREVIGNA